MQADKKESKLLNSTLISSLGSTVDLINSNKVINYTKSKVISDSNFNDAIILDSSPISDNISQYLL